MPDLLLNRNDNDSRRLRLHTLVRLRWLAVAGQAIAVLTVHYGLGFPLPLGAALVVIGLSAWLNIALRARFPLSHRVEDGAAAMLLAYDIMQLAALLYLTGGLENPFAFLFLAPVMISATTLPPGRTVVLGVLAIIAATALAFWHQPLPWIPGEIVRLPPLYVTGVWLSILLGLAFIGVYAWRVSEEARQLSDALAATELVLAREQHLTQLDGLAAAAAHELGTPLATIALVAKELHRAVPEDSPYRDDILLLQEQTARCRSILSKIASLGSEHTGPLGEMTLAHLLEEVTQPARSFGVAISVACQGTSDEPVCRRNPALLHSLGNLVENAVDFARQAVVVAARYDDTQVTITIRDDGPGFSPEVLGRLGEPYLTTRTVDPARRQSGGGLGLGLFIAKTLLERTGALFAAGNAVAPETGAIITVQWSRPDFENRRIASDEPSRILIGT